jgi:hypothetical protein
MPPVDHTAGGLRIQGNVPSFQLLCKIEPPSGFPLRAGMRPDPTIRRRHVPDAAGLEPGYLSSFYGSFKWRPPGSGTVALRAAYHGNMVSQKRDVILQYDSGLPAEVSGRDAGSHHCEILASM